MKIKVLLISGIIMQITIFSCQEIYNDSSIKAGKDMLVVQGMITNADGPYVVKLSKAIVFNDAEQSVNSEELAVKGAEVIIRDDYGNAEILSEPKPGYYTTSAGGIKGIIGRTYTLFIRTPEENNYQSKPCLLKPAPEITSLYPEMTEELVLVEKEDGTSSFEKTTGVSVYADITTQPVENAFYRFDIRIIKQTRKITLSFPPVIIYCWKTDYIKGKQNLKALVNFSGNQLKKYPLTFLVQEKYPPESLVAFAESFYLDGRIVACDVYSVSEEAFNFYTFLYEQLTAENRIFDPIPTNLTGNIFCTNDTSKLVMGIFEASSKSSRNCLIRYTVGNSIMMYRNVDYVPDSIGTNCQENERPSFWQEILK